MRKALHRRADDLSGVNWESGYFPVTPFLRAQVLDCRTNGPNTRLWWGVSVEDRKYGVPRIEQLQRTPARVRFLSVEPLLEDLGGLDLADIHWVIVGGESGRGARRMEPEWVQSIHNQCTKAEVPSFFKQWGGVRKSKFGRSLNGRTYDEMPRQRFASMPSREDRRALLQSLAPLVQDEPLVRIQTAGNPRRLVHAWELSMKPLEYYRGKEQTYLKHFFLEQYLETVAFHIGYTQREFVYVDCFSGPWRHGDENLADTSIRISLDKLNYVRDGLAAQEKYLTINAIFIEKDPASFAALQQAVERHHGSVRAMTFPGEFEDNIPQIVLAIHKKFAFIFIDPTGWNVQMDRITPLLRHQPGEVVINLMYDFTNRFINATDAPTEASLDRFFGCTDWRALRERQDRQNAIVEFYIERVRAVGDFPYVT